MYRLLAAVRYQFASMVFYYGVTLFGVSAHMAWVAAVLLDDSSVIINIPLIVVGLVFYQSMGIVEYREKLRIRRNATARLVYSRPDS